MTKTKDEPKYRNIPVKPDVYAKVRLVAEGAGLGERGLGALVNLLVSQELPECGHETVPVEIEYFGSSTQLAGQLRKRTGYYCATCKRVYARVAGGQLAADSGGKG